jgi:hypothetical protein
MPDDMSICAHCLEVQAPPRDPCPECGKRVEEECGDPRCSCHRFLQPDEVTAEDEAKMDAYLAYLDLQVRMKHIDDEEDTYA